ncbi:putative bifunctional diguanylate cyclase/phosphodiesterase [Paractinoplanes globisporus]|uniref:Bifunctional diguanylate cyclase/phosphodiesterase n=1 Tax=Paractinoplanes globisporus TaxID=113565 RepID=A0ABW6W3R7_9ACTN|nr:EAL domain-containing protein [Actinoplanes globisporus]
MTIGALISLGYPLLPSESVASTVVYNGLGVVSFLVILVGVRRNRPPRVGAWLLFAAGVIMFVSADIVYEVSGLVLGTHPYPYWDDLLYFLAYPMLWLGLLRTGRGRGRARGPRDLAGAIDAAVIAVAVGLVYWVFIIEPGLGDLSTPLSERLVTVGYPTFDVLMCTVTTIMLTRTGGRTPSALLLAAGCGFTLAGDVIWTLTESFASYSGGLINAIFLLGYVSWAAAALHPSMRPTAIAAANRVNQFGRGRLGLLAACTLLVPAVLFIQGIRHDEINWLSVGVGAIALFLLVLARLAGFVGQVQDQAGRLERLAMRDDLTGLANRRRFEEAVTEVVAAGPAQVCLLDLNDFKVVNDLHGHHVGDRLLAAVAERLTGALREADLVARMGGDEFAVLAPDATTEDGDAIVRRLIDALREPIVVGGHELLVAATLGIADATADADPVEVLRRADVAMYAAKEGGSRQHRRYCPELDDRAGEAARLGVEMRMGLDTGQFRMVYQPIVALPEGRTLYVESLVRWQHPERGFVSPADFIPVAEQNGLIVELGEWILRTACAQFMRWREEHGANAPERISVNVSARQLNEPGFVTVVADVLERTGMPASSLIVEVTETAVFGGGTAVQAVKDIHALGVRIALDDFGTGHSSLGLLQTIPVDVLKVDKSFVDNLTMAGRHAVIATALIQVSNGLGLTAVAEGVETAEQAAELHRLGYQLAQGYHFGRPVAEPDFTLTEDQAVPVR